MLFDRFWDVTGDIVPLNHYANILKWKYVTKAIDNNHFYHFDDFLQTVIEVMVIMLCMHLAGYSTIKSFHTQIERSNWSSFIRNVKHCCLGFTKVRSIQDKTSTRTNTTVAAALRVKKEQWANLKDQLSESNQIKVEKDLLLRISLTNQDIVQENALLLLNYSLLYINFNNTCRKGYSGRVEKYIVCWTII